METDRCVISPLHQHTLYRTDVRSVYIQSSGEWYCDICKGNNGPKDFYPAHCSLCRFDLCDNCIKPYRSTFHPGHVLYKADPNVTYPRFNGVWRCDECSRSFNPQNIPFHCSQCEFDLCDNCMKNAEFLSGTRSPVYASRTQLHGNPIAVCSDDANQEMGRTGAPDEMCALCLERRRNAQFVHGETSHVCYCLPCAQGYYARQDGCPVCGAPVDRVIQQYII